MSALGQKQTSRHVRAMSALLPKADIGTQRRNVRYVPKTDICGAANSSLFDHLVGEAKQRDWKNQTKFVGRFHIDGKVHPRGLLDGHFG